MANYDGTSSDDTYTGTEDPDVINGNAGNDTLSGAGGDDQIDGGDANDILHGDAGNDTLNGGAVHGSDLLDGGTGADTMTGGLGDDSYYVDDALDQVIEANGAGYDTVFASIDYTLGSNVEHLTLLGSLDLDGTGNTLNNMLTGNSGNNVLAAGGGLDTLAGSLGDDTYYVEGTFDIYDDFNAIGRDSIVENAGEGIDTVYSAGDVRLDYNSEVEFIILTGTVDSDARGSTTDNAITGNGGNNLIDGGSGSDTLDGGDGRDRLLGLSGADIIHGGTGADFINGGTYGDTLHGDDDNDVIFGGNGTDTLFGGAGDDRLIGEADNDQIEGGNGIDYIDGGTGADAMSGQAGDDEYFVDNVGDQVFEAAGAGFDTVNSTISFDAVGQDIEKIRLIASGPLNAYGNALDNALTGGGGQNLLYGRAGNDVYFVQNTNDRAIEVAGEGNDTVFSSVSFTIEDNVESLRLTGTTDINATGNGAANLLEGNGGNNVLNGQAGADTMYGRDGNDIFYVDNLGDKVFEAAGEGIDRIFSNVSYALSGQSVENLTLTGSAAINATGNTLANELNGNNGVNMLRGMSGDDTYYVQTVGDQVIEADGGGTDRVFASISFDLAGQFAENLTLTTATNLNGYGNGLANVLTGNIGNNLLDGRGGADTMAGGLGNDTYVIDSTDTLVELVGQGTDTVMASFGYRLLGNFENLTLTGTGNINGVGNVLANVITGNSGINELKGGAGDDTYYVQNSTDRVFEAVGEGTDSVFASVTFSIAGQYVEKLTLTGSGNTGGTGNSLANTLQGNSGANNIRGMDGNDSLYGGLGSDLLIGGAGADGFYFDTALGASNIDAITDFNAFDDTIYLDRDIFTTILVDGQLADAGFGYAGDPSKPDARIIYDAATGALSYDADGAGAGGAVQFATLSTGLFLSNEDFVAYH